ncbi:MAG: sugar transferase, partial [Candidatus Kapaibacterium sp.]
QQVNQGHVNTYEGTCTRVEFDRYYIANASLWLDLKIVLMTINTMVRGAKSR